MSSDVQFRGMTIGCDVDDVCADTVYEWISQSNERWNDNVLYNDIKSWDITSFLKPEARPTFYDILAQPTFYESVKPVLFALEGVEALRSAGHRVIFISSCGEGQYDQKWRWLVRNGFLPKKNRFEPDFIAASDKAIFYRSLDLMIDDKTETAREFGLRGVLFRRPWNIGTATWISIASRFANVNLVGDKWATAK